MKDELRITNHELRIWIDLSPRRPGEQMALDEAAFLFSLEQKIAMLRVYQWSAPAVTIGYFDPYPENESRPVVRRITGGGLVEHGADITFCLTLPPGCEPVLATTENRYRWIHESLNQAFTDFGLQFAPETKHQKPSTKNPTPCFSKAVKWDLLDSQGRKLVGGAQKKSRGGVIHQGSIRLPEEPPVSLVRAGEQIRDFAGILAREVCDLSPSNICTLQLKAQNLATEKYQTLNWSKHRKINPS
jgi:lipoyl(octanoyl) transferase